MSIERGSARMGDATPAEQLVTLRKTLADYLTAGRDGTSVVESVRQRIADLERQDKVDTAANGMDRKARDAAAQAHVDKVAAEAAAKVVQS